MKVLIVYSTTFGNTEKIAESMATALKKHATVRVLAAEEASLPDLQEADLLIMGCPTQFYDAPQAIQTLLYSIPHGSLEGVKAVAFDTRYRQSVFLIGAAGYAIARRLQMAGASLIVPPKSFFVLAQGPLEHGERERAGQWAGGIFEEFEAGRFVRS